MHTTKWKKPIREAYMLYDFNYATFQKRKCGQSEKISGCQSWGWGWAWRGE